MRDGVVERCLEKAPLAASFIHRAGRACLR